SPRQPELGIAILELIDAVRNFYKTNRAGCLVEVADARSIAFPDDERGARALRVGPAKEIVGSDSLFLAPDSTLNVLGLEQPAHPESVSAKPSMKRARGLLAVKIDKVPPGDHSKLSKVEMRVERLKRIVSPGDLVEPFLKGEFALRELEIKTCLAVSVLIAHGEHVRMKRDLTVFEGGKSVSEPDHVFVLRLEGAKQKSAGVLSCDESCGRDDIQIAELPGFSLDVFNYAELVDRFELTNKKSPIVDGPFEHL